MQPRREGPPGYAICMVVMDPFFFRPHLRGVGPVPSADCPRFVVGLGLLLYSYTTEYHPAGMQAALGYPRPCKSWLAKERERERERGMDQTPPLVCIWWYPLCSLSVRAFFRVLQVTRKLCYDDTRIGLTARTYFLWGWFGRLKSFPCSFVFLNSFDLRFLSKSSCFPHFRHSIRFYVFFPSFSSSSFSLRHMYMVYASALLSFVRFSFCFLIETRRSCPLPFFF